MESRFCLKIKNQIIFFFTNRMNQLKGTPRSSMANYAYVINIAPILFEILSSTSMQEFFSYHSHFITSNLLIIHASQQYGCSEKI